MKLWIFRTFIIVGFPFVLVWNAGKTFAHEMRSAFRFTGYTIAEVWDETRHVLKLSWVELEKYEKESR